jgi:hypothetical protein
MVEVSLQHEAMATGPIISQMVWPEPLLVELATAVSIEPCGQTDRQKEKVWGCSARLPEVAFVSLLDTDIANPVVGSYTNEEAHAQKL